MSSSQNLTHVRANSDVSAKEKKLIKPNKHNTFPNLKLRKEFTEVLSKKIDEFYECRKEYLKSKEEMNNNKIVYDEEDISDFDLD